MCIFLVFGYPCGVRAPPLFALWAFCVGVVWVVSDLGRRLSFISVRLVPAVRGRLRSSWSVIMSYVSFVPSAFVVSRPSPASWLAWSAPVRIVSYEWVASSRSVRLTLDNGNTPSCRYDNLANDAERADLTDIIRRLVRQELPVVLGVAGNNRGSHWFCAIRCDEDIIQQKVDAEHAEMWAARTAKSA